MRSIDDDFHFSPPLKQEPGDLRFAAAEAKGHATLDHLYRGGAGFWQSLPIQ